MYKKRCTLLKIITVLGMIAGIQSATLLDARCQASDFSISGGLSTFLITGDNVAQQPLVEWGSVQPKGGSLNGTHPGIGVRLTYFLDKEKNFRLPLGFDYYFLSAAQRVILNTKRNDYFTNDMSIPSLTLGFHYAFVSIPFANAKVYAGLEARGSFIPETNARISSYDIKTGNQISNELYSNYNEDVLGPDGYLEAGKKVAAFRLGGALRLGIEGELLDPVYINISGAYGVLNLNRDDSRRELLTPNYAIEKKESPVQNFLVSVMIEYRY